MVQTEPGDLILVKTPGIGFALARCLVRSKYDHIAVVLNDDETLNIVVPRAVMLPVAVISKPANAPLVLRPGWEVPEQRENFIAEMRRYTGVAYDTRKALMGILLTLLNTWLGLKVRLRKRDGPITKSICTEAILLALIKAIPSMATIHGMKLDYNVLGFGTTNDFLRVAGQSPHLLRIVP